MPLQTLDATTLTQLRTRLLGYARRSLRDEADAEDLTQEVLLALLDAPEAYLGRAQLSTYATGILKHKIADLVRTRVRARQVVHEAGEQAEVQTDATPAPEEQLEQARERAAFWPQLRAGLRTLPPALREAFVLREVQDLDTAHVVRALGVSANHAAVLLHRAKAQLRRGWVGDVALAM